MNFYKMRDGSNRWPKVLFLGLLFFLLAGVGTVLGVRHVYQENLKPLSSIGESKLVTVPRGATPHEIAVLLEDEGIIKESWAFEWYVRNQGLRENLKAGTYALRPTMTIEDVANILTRGQIATDLVTILPGQRLEFIRDGLINAGFSAETVDKALDAANYRGHPALVDKPSGADLEGYLYPESFQKTGDTTPQEVIGASLDELQKRLTPQLRAGIVDQGLTVHEGVILASIVGQEGKTEQERKQIAQVFLKRLEVGMELGADATTRYAINKPTGPLTAAELDSDSPYNTRKFVGLPPGPISNFTETALEAVAFPAPGEYLFFVTGRDGETRFSETFEQHQALIAEYGASGEE